MSPFLNSPNESISSERREPRAAAQFCSFEDNLASAVFPQETPIDQKKGKHRDVLFPPADTESCHLLIARYLRRLAAMSERVVAIRAHRHRRANRTLLSDVHRSLDDACAVYLLEFFVLVWSVFVDVLEQRDRRFGGLVGRFVPHSISAKLDFDVSNH